MSILRNVLAILWQIRDAFEQLIAGALFGIFVFITLTLSLVFSAMFGANSVLQIVVTILVIMFAFRLAMESKS